MMPLMEFSPRQPRLCNAIAFSPLEPRYLACGLDRVRNDHGLLIWDIEASATPMTPNPTTQGVSHSASFMGGGLHPFLQGGIMDPAPSSDPKQYFTDRSNSTPGPASSIDFEGVYFVCAFRLYAI
jgi:hypothetical protein